ncbi:hypothetical protein AKJ16_DCAP13711, partial [Drosera capensis]
NKLVALSQFLSYGHGVKISFISLSIGPQKTRHKHLPCTCLMCPPSTTKSPSIELCLNFDICISFCHFMVVSWPIWFERLDFDWWVFFKMGI